MTADPRKIYLNPVEKDPIKQNAIARQLIEVASVTPPPITPEAFGAVGDGVTDDTAAVQAAINAALAQTANGRRAVYLPQTYYTRTGFTVAPSSSSAYFALAGNSKQRITFITDQNIPILTFDATNSLYYASVSDIAFAGDSTFTKTSQDGILVKNQGTAGSFFSYYNFSNLFMIGLYRGIHFSTANDNCDWGMINNVNLNSVRDGIIRTAGGTGCVYWGGQIVLSGTAGGSAISIGGSGTPTIGDITIGGFQMGGTGSGVVINNTGGYGSNISVSNMQMDAGISPAFNLANVHSLEARNINWGGASGPNVIGATCTDLELDERRLDVIATATATTNNLALAIGQGRTEYVISGGNLTITGMAGGYDGREFEIYNGGTSNNVILNNEDAGSSAGNRFHLGANATIAPGQSILLLYMGNNGTTTTNRWVRRGGG